MWLNTSFEAQITKHMAVFIEPLQTTAPPEARPYCYGVGHIAFYYYPYEVDGNGGFKKHDDIRSTWNLLGRRWTNEDIGWSALDPFVMHEGQIYELLSGAVKFMNGWVVSWTARRIQPDDHRLPSLRGMYPELFNETPTPTA